MPVTNASGDAKLPWLEKIDARIATPTTPPSSRSALFEPEATPSSSGFTLESTMLAAGAQKSDEPIPPTTSAGRSDAYDAVAVALWPSQATDPASSVRP